MADAGFDAIFGSPYVSYLVDVLTDPAAWRMLFAVPLSAG